jgi:MFS family permease
MTPRPSASITWVRITGVTVFAFALGTVTNTLEPALLGHKALELIPSAKNTALGLTTFAGLLVALLWQPIVGGWSDRSRTRWGRRIPFFVGGTAVASAALLLIAVAPVYGLVVAGLLTVQLGANTIQSPWQALLPEQIPAGLRGRASGFKATLEILAFLVGRWTSGQLISRGEVALAALVPAAALALAAGWTIAAGEGARQVGVGGKAGWVLSLRSTFRVDWARLRGFRAWCVNRFLFWGGFIALNTFLLFYLVDVAGMAEPQAQRFLASVSAALGAAILVVTLPAGWLADRIGRRLLVCATGLTAAAGTAWLLAARNEASLLAAGVLLGVGIGSFLSADWALLTDLVPRDEAARHLGIANIAGAGGSAAARFLGGALIDPVNRWSASSGAGYRLVYGLALIAFVAAAVVILRAPDPVRESDPAPA